MALVQTEVPVEIHAELKRICTLKGITVKQQVRELIEEFVRKEMERRDKVDR